MDIGKRHGQWSPDELVALARECIAALPEGHEAKLSRMQVLGLRDTASALDALGGAWSEDRRRLLDLADAVERYLPQRTASRHAVRDSAQFPPGTAIEERLRVLIHRSRQTKSEVADRAGISRETLHKALNGTVSHRTALRLAHALGVPVEIFTEAPGFIRDDMASEER